MESAQTISGKRFYSSHTIYWCFSANISEGHARAGHGLHKQYGVFYPYRFFRLPLRERILFLVAGTGPEVDIAFLGILVDLCKLIIGKDEVVQSPYILLDLIR